MSNIEKHLPLVAGAAVAVSALLYFSTRDNKAESTPTTEEAVVAEKL